MNRVTRRTALSAVAAVAAAKPTSSEIQLSEVIGWGQTSRMRLLKQVGVNHAIATVASELVKVPRTEYVPTLQRIKAELDGYGLKIAGVESHPVSAKNIKLGLPGRDEEIENYIAAIRALKAVGIDTICYDFCGGLGWYRTKVDCKERGGALCSEFSNAEAMKQGPTEWGEVTEKRMWSNIQYFLEAVIPVAEKEGVKMALHPDDPPLNPLRGISRIVVNSTNYERIMKMVPSPVNGVTFCQANFVAMGENIQTLAARWCRENKIFFIHYRDIRGTKEHFRETFHDNGPTDMAKMLEIYSKNGFHGPIRPDHAPTLEGESNAAPGYAMSGKLFAFGYMIGVMKALNLKYS